MAPTPTGDGYARDVPPELFASADRAVLALHRAFDGIPTALVVTAYRRGRTDEAAAHLQRNAVTDKDLADEIRTWLAGIIPPWPEDQALTVAGHFFRGPAYGGTAVDFDCHPDPHSHTMPVGALIRALSAALDYGGPDTARAVAAALTANGVDLPEPAAGGAETGKPS
ncbi:hypothetical protein [Micromonospora sp. DT227]|uniref:hypothetical protein n=1 Tax=Micromonospora sp. DT227 TaxID=3393433 RepID=UPI003CF5153D